MDNEVQGICRIREVAVDLECRNILMWYECVESMDVEKFTITKDYSSLKDKMIKGGAGKEQILSSEMK